MEIPFNGPTQEGRLSLVGAQQSVNLYPKLQSPGDKNKISLYSCPGLKFLVSNGSGACRSNGVTFKEKLYFVAGADLISIDSAGVSATIGTLNTSGGRVSLVAGRDYLALVDGTDGYTWNDTTFAIVSDLDFPASPSHITYLDGYFIVNKGSSDEFYISTVEDPTAWAALDFATAEASPDDVLAHVATDKDLLLCGETTSQVYYDSKNPDFPFDPYPNGVIQMGIEAKHTLVSSLHGAFWLGRTREGEIKVVNVKGLQINVISSDDITWQISQFTDASDAIAWIEQDGDRTLYVITFPTADKTYCYDVGLPKEVGWFEKKSWNVGRWRASGYGAIGSKRIIGDYVSSDFYTLDFNTFDENGNILERIRRAQIIHSEKKDITIYEFLLDLQVGVGITTGQGSDPQIMLRYSHDGGDVWESELWEDLGKKGKRNIEVYWSKLGAERDWLFEVKVTDPVEVNIIAAYGDIEVSDW
jgi:hypothetical protein